MSDLSSAPVTSQVSAAVVSKGSDWSVLRRALRETGVTQKQIWLSIAAGTLSLGSAVGLSAVAAWLIARAAQMPSPADLAVAAVAVRFFGINRGLFRYVERLVSHNTALSGLVTLRERMIARLADAGPAKTLALTRGDIVARLGADMDAIGDAVVRAIVPAGVALSVSVIAIGISFFVLPVAGIVMFACLLLAAIVPTILTTRSARLAAQAHITAGASVAASSLSLVESAPEHRVWGTLPQARQELVEADKELDLAMDYAARPGAVASAVQTLASGLALIAGIGLAVAAVEYGDLDGPMAAIIALLPLAAFEAVGGLTGAATQYFRSASAARRVLAMFPEPGFGVQEPTPAASTSTEGAVAEPIAAAHAPRLPLHLNEVSAAWPGMVPTTPLSSHLEPGQSLAVIGRSGIGKTTLLLTIAGALEPDSGSVTWGEDKVGPEHTGHSIALILEDAHVFGTTVLENLRVANGQLSEEAAAAVLDRVGLLPWIATLPHGIDTELGSGGNSVSGGERRRLLLARALVSTAPVLLIDEPAEHLDVAGESVLGEVLADLRAAGRTVVVVTHDMSVLDHVDEVINLDT